MSSSGSSSSSSSSSSFSSSSSDDESAAPKQKIASRKRKQPEHATPERSPAQDEQQQEQPSPFKFGGEDVFRPDCYLGYKRKLNRFMEHKHKKPKKFYTDEHEFTLDELLQITPKDIVRFFCNMLYGKDKPAPNDLPTKGRARNATAYKSGISHFMPNSSHEKIGNIESNIKSYDANRAKEMASMKRVMMRRANELQVTTRKRKHTTTDDIDDEDREDPNAATTDNHHHQVLPADASLSKTPRDLYALWDEYDNGIGGRKAAKNFTAHEKGQCTSTYCRRKVLWDLIQRVINHSGTDYRTAIEEIYGVYGYLSITKLHKKVLADEKAGGHPNLYPDAERASKRRKGRNS